MIAGLNLLDFILLAILCISILFGIFKGFIRELLSLAFFIIAVVLSFLFYQEIGSFFMKGLKNREMANFVAFISIFVVVLIIGAIVTFFSKKAFTFGPLKAIDKILGGVFGLVRGILVGAIIIYALVKFPVNNHLLHQSRLAPYGIKTIELISQLLPTSYQKHLHVNQ